MPYDLDIFLHMNNGIYLKHCDIGRLKLWAENNVWQVVVDAKGTMVAAASNNRYRREITVFTAYEIRSKVSLHQTQ